MTYARESGFAPLGLPLVGVDMLLVGLAAAFCLTLWLTSAQLLVASTSYTEARVLSCRYFTGMRVVEKQYYRSTAGGSEASCPLIKLG